MSRTITLLLHVGFGKTATTYMQKQIFSKIALNEDNCIYFGKLGNDEIMLNDSFHKLHYELFNSLNGLMRYRSRNSTRLVNSYAKVVSDQIINKFGCDSGKMSKGGAIISNESLLGYGGYNAELNMFLLKMVIERVRENLREEYKIEEKVLVTFREQVSLLKSHFAYDYYHQSDKFKTFDKFIEYGVENHHDDIFGSLWIDEVIQFMNNIFGKENLYFVPYELLKKNEKEFLTRTVVRSGLISKDKIDGYLNLKKENVNTAKNTGNNLIRDISGIQKIIATLSQYKQFIPSFALGFAKKIYFAISKRQKTIMKGEVVMTQKQKEQIMEIYRNSNTKAAKMISIDLRKLGYAIEE